MLVVSTERGNGSLSVTAPSNVVKSKSSERNCCMNCVLSGSCSCGVGGGDCVVVVCSV